MPRRAIIRGIGIPSNTPEADAEVPENPEVDDDRHIVLAHREAESEHLFPAVRKERAQVVPARRLESSTIVLETVERDLRRHGPRDGHDGASVVLVLDVPDGLKAYARVGLEGSAPAAARSDVGRVEFIGREFNVRVSH